ncbi:MAG: TetR/AcrR family transcriptional regulator [Bacteroidota bacterium]|nr:TetR/AcrR family transcriptional regulator [Bacteroidota bacterium]MDW8137506.1 TetR/AcrR family transcriptional regulator [Bacteroidota bacterium]
MSTLELSRREREKQQRRNELLQAARQVFAERGYEGATLEEIAQRAQLGKGTVYNYFPSKQELFFSILDEVHAQGLALAKAVMSRPLPLQEKYRQYMLEAIGLFQDNLDLFQILIKDGQRLLLEASQREAGRYWMHKHQALVEVLRQPLEQAIAEGQIRPLAPSGVVYMILGAVHHYMMLTARQEEAPRPEELADFVVSVLFEGLLPRS